MIRTQRNKLIAFILFLVILVPLAIILINLASCAQTQTRVGWIGSQTKNQIAYSYSRFQGAETTRLYVEEGQELILSSEVKVTDGSIHLRVVGPKGMTVWEETLQETREKTIGLPIKHTGHYTIVIEGIDTSGNFNVHWEIK
jgi:hypothetical protein